MGLLTPLRGQRRATLRVTADGAPAVFDALLVFDGARPRLAARELSGERTPFALDLPDVDVTIVVQPRDPGRPVVAEYEREVNGRRRLWGRAWRGTPVLRRRGGAIICAGLPGRAGPAAGAPAI
jgi:hypothetical protein